MGLFNKKEDVPEIPSAPTLPELPKQEEKVLSELPSFPSDPKNEAFNQEIVKSAVTDMPSPEENEVNVEIPEGLHITEESKEESLIPPRSSIKNSIPEFPKQISTTEFPKKTLEISESMSNVSTTKQVEPIFVRIDKFQSAQKNLVEIKSKINEIELILGKIKEVKTQEEAELKGWSEDIEKVKSRLAEIDKDVFSQI